MDRAMLSLEKELQALPEIKTVLSNVGSGGFLNQVSAGNITVKLAPHEERYFSFARFFKGLVRFDFAAAFRGNYTQADVMEKSPVDGAKV